MTKSSKVKVKHVYNDYDRRTSEVRNKQNKARRMINNLRKEKGLAPLTSNQHVDHKKPLSKGGTNSVRNLQVLSALKNMKKGAKHCKCHKK